MKASRRQLAVLRSLRTRKGRRETGLFLVEGLRLCRELLGAKLPVEFLVSAGQEVLKSQTAELVGEFGRAGVAVLHAPMRDVERISDTVHSQGIIAAARWRDVSVESLSFGERAVVLALDRVSDPGNVGAIIRTASWFGATAVFLGEGCADLLNPKTVRATMGGLFHIPVCRGIALPTALEELKQDGFRIVVAAADGSPDWRSWAAAPRSVLVLGSEAHGVSAPLRALADATFAIPREGHGESLNVAVTAGIFLSAGIGASRGEP